MINITSEESLLLQSLSVTALLGELSNNNFLNSDYFENLPFENESFKSIIKMSGLGNPASMQIMLYALLVVPKELFSKTSYNELETHFAKINQQICAMVEDDTYSTYDNEGSKEKINYLRHLRNAVAHSKCDYFDENQKCFVVFNDNHKAQQCSIKIECVKVGILLMDLQNLVLEYFKEKYKL
ncbi:MAG: hypothetical protein IJA02_06455 [Clostridia bacterium]|nr:hypothetical protein [Clostridia bacterium]